MFDVYFSADRIVHGGCEIWVLGAVIFVLADWKTPRFIIFNCVLQLNNNSAVTVKVKVLCPTFAFYLYCQLFTYQYILKWSVLLLFYSKLTFVTLTLLFQFSVT